MFSTAFARTLTIEEINSTISDLYNKADQISFVQKNTSADIIDHNEKVFKYLRKLIKVEAPILMNEIKECIAKHPSQNRQQLCVRSSFAALANKDNLMASNILMMIYDAEKNTAEFKKWKMINDKISAQQEQSL
jgi:hypothetical protein